MVDITGLKIQFQCPIFVDQMPPTGFLVREPACHALWWYYMLAMSARAKVGKSIDDQIIEYNAESGEAPPLWMDKRYNAQIKSIAMLCGVAVEDMLAFCPAVKLEISRLGMPPVPGEIEFLTGRDR